MIILNLLTFDIFLLLSSIFQYGIILIVLWKGDGAMSTPRDFGQVNLTLIVTIKFFILIKFIIHGSIFSYRYEYVLLIVLWQGDHGKAPMLPHQVNDSVIVHKHDYSTFFVIICIIYFLRDFFIDVHRAHHIKVMM